MRSFCVGDFSRHSIVRSLIVTGIAALVAVAVAIPDAEAARRKKRLVKGYSPPYASICYDVNSGRILQETNADALRHPASITKVMTLYMLFEQMERGRFRLDSELPVSHYASRQEPSKLGLKPGETISVEDAIKALVTKSANDAAMVVAEAIGGSEERFGQMMTAKARAIGMSRSTFYNPHGLPNPRQFTTARDLVTLGKAIQDRFPKYYAYFGTRSFAYDGAVYRNHNKLLGRVEGVDGIKTGYTRASGFNLLTSAKTEGRHIITVVLGGHSGRARDIQVAALVEQNMPRALAGRRTPRANEVASAEIETDEIEIKPAQRLALASPANPHPVANTVEPALRSSVLPVPPNRPRTAVIAETGATAGDPGLIRGGRPLALAASGSTRIVQGPSNPLALIGTTPRSPAQRATSLDTPDGRPTPPGSVRYTNALPVAQVRADEDQPLPQIAETATKLETRLGVTPVVRTAPPESAQKPASQMVAKEAIPAKEAAPARVPPTAMSARTLTATLPARSGWVIQLAAADSEAKARAILESAREKSGRLLKEAEPFTEAVSKGAATFFRARFAGFDADEAQAACKALKRNGFNCFAQKI